MVVGFLLMGQVLNKVDLLTSAQLQQATEWLQGNTGAAAVLPISALSSDGVEAVRQWAVKHLPLGPTLYPKVRARIINAAVSCDSFGSEIKE